MKTSQLIARALAISLPLCAGPAMSADNLFHLSVPFPTHPGIASELGIDGFVLLKCQPQSRRELNCAVGEESPLGFGFGAAALAASRNIRVVDGPVPAQVSVPFQLKAPRAASLPPPPTERSVVLATRWYALIEGAQPLYAARPPSIGGLDQLSPEARLAVERTRSKWRDIVNALNVRAIAREFDRTAQAQDIETASAILLRSEGAELTKILASKSMRTDLLAWGSGRPDRQEMATVFSRVFSRIKPTKISISDDEVRIIFRQSVCAAVDCEIVPRPAAIQTIPR